MKFYRYDLFYYDRGPEVGITTFKLLKETPKGYWITFDSRFFCSWKKWIPKVSRKRYAYPTKEEALNSFTIRKKKQIKHCERDIRNAKAALSIVEKMKVLI